MVTPSSGPVKRPRPSLGERLRDNRVVFLGLTITLAVITGAYYVVLRGRDLDPALVNNQILLFFLRNVNFVLITALAGVLLRNLTKLWFEYRGRKLGAKLKTKLVVTYIGLSLIPVLLLFAIANEVVQGSLDAVFRTPEVDPLESGYQVSVALTEQIENQNRLAAELVLEGMAGLDLNDRRAQQQLDGILGRYLERLDVDVVYAFVETDFAKALIDPSANLDTLPDIDQSLLLAALRDGSSVQVQQLVGREGRPLLLGAAAASDGEAGARVVTVAGTLLEPELAQMTRNLVELRQTREQVDVQEPEIRAVQTLTFLMVTLVLLLACSWVGLYLARQVTVPIQALAEGTRRVAEGELDHRVEAPADDELGVLVDSFNRMTEELQRSKSQVEEGTRDLMASNAELERARQRIDTVLRNVTAGVISVDAGGVVRTCNVAAGRMLGREAATIEGRALDDLLQESPQLAPVLEPGEPTSRQAGPRQQVRVDIDGQGDWRTFEVTSTALRDADDATGRVLVLEDLTELIRVQKLATWNEAARRIAHEIKNPLTPIKLSAERLLRKYQAEDPQFGSTLERSVQIIGREVGKMQSLVEEFARFARMPQPSPQPVDVGALCRDVVHLYSQIKDGVEVVALTGPTANGSSDFPASGSSPPAAEPPRNGDLTASVDEELLRSALTNLLDNAIEATDGPGTIVLRTARLADTLRIQVADPGRGVPAEAKERLFLPYYSTKGRGTGLGLSIVHRIVTDHHGTIRVDDNEPRGTVFTIDLPV